MATKKTAIFMLALAAALVIALAAPLTAGAYCVYNHTNTSLFVQGEQCLHCLEANIDKGDKACCPGGDKGCRGHTLISFSVNYGSHTSCNNFIVPKEVEAHGWVSLFGSCRKEWKRCNQADACDGITAKVHDKNGKVIYSGKVRQGN